MYEFFLGKYGLDWAAAVFMFISLWRLGDHHRDGFIYAAVACAFWIAFNTVVESAAGIAANAIILGLSVRNFARARRRDEASGGGAGSS
jgi:hypothetical protein